MGAYVCLPPLPWVELGGGLKRLPCSKYYNVGKGENRLPLGFNTAKNTYYMKKSYWDFNFLCSNKSCWDLHFLRKFFEPFFPIFWQHWALKSICFPISTHYNISNMTIFWAPQLHSGKGDRYVRPFDHMNLDPAW